MCTYAYGFLFKCTYTLIYENVFICIFVCELSICLTKIVSSYSVLMRVRSHARPTTDSTRTHTMQTQTQAQTPAQAQIRVKKKHTDPQDARAHARARARARTHTHTNLRYQNAVKNQQQSGVPRTVKRQRLCTEIA